MTQISKIIQSGRLLGRFLRPLLKVDLSLMKNLLQPLAKIVLIPLGLTAAASTVDVRNHKNILESIKKTLISSEEMKDILKTVKSLKDSGILLKGVNNTT